MENLDDHTFAKKFVIDKSQFALVSTSTGGGTAKKWVRFPKFYFTDYFCMENYSWDAVAFMPKKPVKFFGFGLMSNYEKKDIELKLKWYIDEEPSEEIDLDLKEEEKDQEKWWFEIYLKDLG